MSNELAIVAIETVKNKLQKYVTLKQNEKVKEYLNKLHNTSVTPSLLRATKIDMLVSQLASDNKAIYSSTAKTILKKWHDKNLLPKPTNTSKVKTITNTKKSVVEKKFAVKRKSDDDDDDDETHSNTLSESQSSDEYKIGEKDRTSSSSTKKRKVLSIAEYVGNKKPVSASTTIAEPTENKLTDTEIEKIYAQFSDNIKELAATAPVLANNVNKRLTQKDSNRNGFIANSHIVQTEQQKPKPNGFWDDEEDDDDADDDHKQSETVKNNKTVNNNNVNIQQVKQSIPTSVTKKATKTDDRSMKASLTSSIVSLEHSQPPPRSFPPPTVVVQKKSDSYNFLRPRNERQAIYSGKRTLRTNIPSLQDLCVETLKDHVDDTCRKHFNLLPYDVVKPIIDLATPEQLYCMVDNNPNYADDVEPLWQHFCALHYKDAERDECESYYELYWRKFNEKEERLQQITELAKRKKAQIVDSTRQTKTLNLRTANTNFPITSKKTVQSSHRQVVGLPPTKGLGGRTKPKKPTIPPLLKKTLKFYNGKS